MVPENQCLEDKFYFSDFGPVSSPTAECVGVSAQYSFGVFWASWGGSGKKTGSGNRFRELVPGAILGTGSGFRWVPTGFAVARLRFRRLSERGFEGFGV